MYRLLAYEDEVFALAAAILDHGSLASAGGTFSESLYGLRRVPAESGNGSGGSFGGGSGGGTGELAGQGQQAAPMLTHRQRRAALLLSVSGHSEPEQGVAPQPPDVAQHVQRSIDAAGMFLICQVEMISLG